MNQVIAAACGAGIWVCNEAVEAGLVTWPIGIPIVVALGFAAARVLTANHKVNGHEP